MKKTCLSFLAIALLAGCQSTSQLASLATPANVQTSITVLGSLAAAKVTTSDKALVHKFASSLLALSVGNIDGATITTLIPSIPAGASPYVAPLISAAVTEINLALTKFGQHNPTVFQYVQAVGNGLINAGF